VVHPTGTVPSTRIHFALVSWHASCFVCFVESASTVFFSLFFVFVSLQQKKSAAKKSSFKYTIKCGGPVADGIFDMASFEKFFHERIKVNGKTGQLSGAVAISRSADALTIDASIEFSKRYLKYLTKKYLKKQQLRDWLRVVADDANSYELRYFNISEDAEDDEGDEE